MYRHSDILPSGIFLPILSNVDHHGSQLCSQRTRQARSAQAHSRCHLLADRFRWSRALPSDVFLGIHAHVCLLQWAGLPIRIVMIGTLTGLQWLIYDSFKVTSLSPASVGRAILTFVPFVSHDTRCKWGKIHILTKSGT